MKPFFLAIRADGGKKLGMGHLYRQAILWKYFKKSQKNTSLFFFIKEDKSGVEWLRRQGVKPVALPASLPRKKEPAWMKSRLPQSDGVFLLDVLDAGREYIQGLRWGNNRIFTFENLSKGKEVADGVINAIVEGPENKIDRKGACQIYRGANYKVFHPVYKNIKKSHKKNNFILVALGGGEDANLSLKAAEIVASLNPTARIVIAQGPVQKLQDRSLSLSRKIKIKRCLETLAPLLARADWAVTAGGGTLYELALMGVPAVAFSKVKHQERNIRHFSKAGSVIDGGRLKEKNLKSGIERMQKFYRNLRGRKNMSAAGRKLVDGKGMSRVLALINKASKETV